MDNTSLEKQKVRDVLAQLKDKISNQNIVDLGMVQSIDVTSEKIRIILELTHEQAREGMQLKSKTEALLKNLSKGRTIDLILTLHQRKNQGPHKLRTEKLTLPNIRHIIAVSSGKGGVGKSLIAVNLAYSLMQKGNKVGLLDLDIYGPSIPTMLGVQAPPKKEHGKMIPNMYKSMPVMSMGFLIAPEKAVIWRGPMVQLAVQQFLEDVVWGDLDYLIIDMPPGTGDAHLSLTQIIPIDGVVLVTTPQDLAYIDVHKSRDMYCTLSIPIIGLVENMSSFTCPNCNETTHPFGQDRTHQLHNIELLAHIPLAWEIRNSADTGTPIADHPVFSNIFDDLSNKVVEKITYGHPEITQVS